MFPEKQKKAQEELDRVVGPERLPTFEDRPSLPYVEAIISECFRWHPTSPAGESTASFFDPARIEFWKGVAHCTTEDDIFENYYIPKGQPTYNVIINTAPISGCRIARQIQYMVRSSFFVRFISSSKAGRHRVHVKIQNHSNPRDICFQMARCLQSRASVVVFCMETLASEDGEWQNIHLTDIYQYICLQRLPWSSVRG